MVLKSGTVLEADVVIAGVGNFIIYLQGVGGNEVLACLIRHH